MQSKKSRIFRIIFGLAIMLIGVYLGSFWGLVGLLPFFVGITGVCPACVLFNRCSLPRK